MWPFDYLIGLWRLWVSVFPVNSFVGSKENTAAVGIVIVIGLAGWLLKRSFGDGSGHN